jgi:hypothetical protein
MTREQASDLLARLETHVAFKASSPGFHLSDDDIEEIVLALRAWLHHPQRDHGEHDVGQAAGQRALPADRDAIPGHATDKADRK